MKKGSAFLLAAALCLQAGFPSYATKAGSGGVGQVDVSIGSALLLQRPVDFSVSLSGGSGRAGSEPGIVRLEPDGASEGSVRFDGLEAGVYTLTDREGLCYIYAGGPGVGQGV